MKDSTGSDLRIRENKWLAAPAVRQNNMNHQLNGKTVRMSAYACAACNRTMPSTGFRLIEDGPGIVCHDCYVYGRRCRVTGCFEVAMHKEEVCRDHLIFDNWNRKEALEEIVLRRREAVIGEEHAPGLEKRMNLDLNKQYSKAMRKMGIPSGSNVGLEKHRAQRRKSKAKEKAKVKSKAGAGLAGKEMNHG